MSKRYPRARWVLPEAVSPPTSTCYAVPVPDDPMHKAAFLGALAILGTSQSWARDDDHTASAVAAVWREIADNLEPCQMLQFRQNEPCFLEVSDDGGETWTIAYDGTLCLQANPEQPGGVIPDPGTCEEFLVNLRPGDLWFLPFAITDQDTVELIDMTGVWSDSGGATLYCADGAIFSAGVCSGGATNVLDPVPTANHMSVILGRSGPNYLAVGEYVTTIPNGTGAHDWWLQSNDVFAGAVNAGSVSFKVRICRSEWSSVIDFTTGLHGWTQDQGNQSGTGLDGTEAFFTPNYYNFAQAHIVLSAATHLVAAVMNFSEVPAGSVTGNQNWIGFDGDDPPHRIVHNNSGTYTNFDLSWSGDANATTLSVTAVSGADPTSGNTGSCHIHSLTLHGTGTKPSELP